MRRIELDPKQFSFPNFCFERKFKNYLFLRSEILANTQEAENYFFEILNCLQSLVENKDSKEKQDIWKLVIPNNIQTTWRDCTGSSGNYYVGKGVLRFTLLEFEKFFSKFYEEKQCHFIQLVDQFWIQLTGKIGVYALYDAEIVVIGTDVQYSLDEIKKKKFTNFFYKSFNEYVDHWGPILRWNESQINLLKKQFSKG